MSYSKGQIGLKKSVPGHVQPLSSQKQDSTVLLGSRLAEAWIEVKVDKAGPQWQDRAVDMLEEESRHAYRRAPGEGQWGNLMQ